MRQPTRASDIIETLSIMSKSYEGSSVESRDSTFVDNKTKDMQEQKAFEKTLL